MPLPTLLLAVLLHAPRIVAALYSEYFFTTEESDWLCPGVQFKCPPPQVCSYQAMLDRYYCCSPGLDSVCWSESVTCEAGRLECGNGDWAFCCLDGMEMCTQQTDQINVCWSTAENPLAELASEPVNATYSSLSSESPTASMLPFDLDAHLSPSTSMAPQTTDAASTTETSSPSSPAETSSSSASLSGGAIAGVVIGVIAGVAIVAIGGFFLWRRRREDGNVPDTAGAMMPPGTAGTMMPPDQKHGYYGGYAAAPTASPTLDAQNPSGLNEVYTPPAEMDGGNEIRGVMEMEGSTPDHRGSGGKLVGDT